MGPASKDLLPLEKPGSSTSSLESCLFICKNMDSVSRNRPSHPDAKPFTAPVHASQVIGRVKDFLGAMSEANRRLEVDAKENPENYDIEVLNGNESRIIEMDLTLGIADLHTAEAISAAESAIEDYQPADSLSASSSRTDSEDTLDDDDDDIDDDNDCTVDHDCQDNRVPGELRKSNSDGDVSSEMTGRTSGRSTRNDLRLSNSLEKGFPRQSYKSAGKVVTNISLSCSVCNC